MTQAGAGWAGSVVFRPQCPCLHSIDAGLSAPPFLQGAPNIAARPTLRATGMKISNGVQERGRGNSTGN